MIVIKHLPAQSVRAVEYSLQRDKTSTLKKYPGYDIKQSDEEATALDLWGMRSTLSLPLLPGSLWPGVVAPDWVLSMG